MVTNHKRKALVISILVFLSFACSYLPLSTGKATITSESASATHEALPTKPSTDTPINTIPVFESTATETMAPAETATSSVSSYAQPTRLKLNGFAFLTYDPPIPNRVRIGPGLGFEAKGLVKPGQVMQVINGPICSGESVWWKVVVKYTELTGWVAEADSEQYWVEPCPAEGHCPPLMP
jgi:hypothetical protein